MDHCSSEGGTVGIQSYLFKTKMSVKNTFKTQKISVQFQIKTDLNFISKSISKITFRNSFQFISKIQIKMTESNHICHLWEHTIVKVFKHDSKSELGLMFKEWIIFNKLENFNSILNYPIDDFTPSGNLCYMNEHGYILPYTPMKKYSP